MCIKTVVKSRTTKNTITLSVLTIKGLYETNLISFQYATEVN